MQKYPLSAPLIILLVVLSLNVKAQTLPQVQVVDELGQKKDLRGYLQTKSLLVLGYYNCKHMCNYMVKDLTKKLEKFQTYPNVIYFGIDENEGPRDALFMKKRIFGPFKRKWSFLVADKKNIEVLRKTLNFEMSRDPVSGVINHELGIYSVEQGKIIRKHDDVNFRESDMKKDEPQSVLAVIKKYCSDYDPRRSKYGPFVMKLLSLSSGIFLALSFIGFLRLKRSRS